MSTNVQATAPAPTPGDVGVVLEKDPRFSASLLWQMNRQYYADSGPAAWHSGEVSSYATCDAYIAQSYANVVLAYLRDAVTASQVDPAHPIYIVELAAGVGRFAHQFLRKLHALLAGSSQSKLDVRYVMTDFTIFNQHALDMFGARLASAWRTRFAAELERRPVVPRVS
jgi:hypothetical protein